MCHLIHMAMTASCSLLYPYAKDLQWSINYEGDQLKTKTKQKANATHPPFVYICILLSFSLSAYGILQTKATIF